MMWETTILKYEFINQIWTMDESTITFYELKQQIHSFIDLQVRDWVHGKRLLRFVGWWTNFTVNLCALLARTCGLLTKPCDL